MSGPQSLALAAQGPQLEGMLRISKGHQERYVWPVHLPGWLAVGWRVAGTAAQPAPRPDVVTEAELTPEPQSESAPLRGKRGRRRKEERDSAIASASISSEEGLVEIREEPAKAAEMELPAETTAQPDPDTAAENPLLTALPDDLFDDPLI